MIVCGYDLHLYCDFCNYGYGRHDNHTFSGATKGAAFKSAAKAGWLVKQKENIAKCPNCRRPENNKKDTNE